MERRNYWRSFVNGLMAVLSNYRYFRYQPTKGSNQVGKFQAERLGVSGIKHNTFQNIMSH